jgi:hypothetical protein
VAIPLAKAIRFASTPEGRKMIQQAVRVARTEEGRRLLSQARKVADTPEGRRLIEHARGFAKSSAATAKDPETVARLKAFRDRVVKPKP